MRKTFVAVDIVKGLILLALFSSKRKIYNLIYFSTNQRSDTF